jgi:hypothetical protein
LLQAALLLKDRPGIRFVFFGGGIRVSDVANFVKQHALKNVVQLPFQPRERLPTLLDLAGLHVVVQGDAVSGLVHPSKIYGVLASGKPYISIAPFSSILADILDRCPHGHRVEHGDAAGLVRAIEQAKALTEEQLNTIARENFAFVRKHFSADGILQRVLIDVLSPLASPPHPIAAKKNVA